MNHRCLICRNSVSDFPEEPGDNGDCNYHCPCCGFVALSREAVHYISTDGFISEKDKSLISIFLRGRVEKKDQDGTQEADGLHEPLTIDQLKSLIKTYRPLDPLGKIENFLFIVEKRTKSPGHFADIKIQTDYPLFHCHSSYELVS
ncbi:MAG: hypothetical protein HQK65_16555, partial [Desulfamplus sp.]|nr:hypothetical protein [Desulfamplus sp.]